MTTYSQKKVNGVLNLASLNVKKVTLSHVEAEAKAQGVSKSSLFRAWLNFLQFGNPVLNEKDLTHKNTVTQKLQKKAWAKTNLSGLTARALTDVEKRNLLKDYFFDTALSVTDTVKKYKITMTQFYDIVRDLNVSGKVNGKMVLNPVKYAKVDVKEVAKFNKKPHLFKGANPIHNKLLQRVSTVLKNYL